MDNWKRRARSPWITRNWFQIDGNFDIDNKRLTSVSDPIDTGDAATKSYVDKHLGSGPDSGASKAYVDSENAILQYCNQR